MELAGKNVVVVGLARSGLKAAQLLARRGARVVATDRKPEGELPPEVVRLREEGVELEAGGHRRESFTAADLVVVSPGVPWELPELEAARSAGVEVLAELELAYRFMKGTVAAVTGTKGKSTTTAALGAMLKETGRDVRVGGNIGEAASGLVEGSGDETVFVLEVSSFQLEGTRAFHPHLAMFLNLSADHLDRHPSFEAYAAAKARIFANQTETDWAVVNADDPAVLDLARAGRARRVGFSPAPPAEGDGAYFAGDEARLARDGQAETLFRRSEVRAARRAPGAGPAGRRRRRAPFGRARPAIARAVRSFTGAEHVLERVAVVGGVAFYNDSKATNVAAARKSLEAFAGPVLAIVGGRYKGGDFAELAPALSRQGKAVLAIGEARERLAQALGAVVPVVPCADLAEAVEQAFARSAPGDTVVLAPACSSFDMFEDYAHRGRAFKEAVRALAERHG